MEPTKIIELLGGNAKTAELCEITPSAVTQWRTNGIPKAQLKFLMLARPDVFKKPSPRKHPAAIPKQKREPDPGARATSPSIEAEK